VKRVKRHSCTTLIASSSQRSVDGVEQENAPLLQGARNLAYHRVEVGHMLEHITAVGKVELAGRYGQPLNPTR